WARDRSLVDDMRTRGANQTYLPDIMLPHGVTVTDAIDEALDRIDLIVSAIPSHGCRAVIRAGASYVAPNATIVSATKGLEADTLLRMSEVIAQELGPRRPVVVLSGPSFAIEVARQLPTAVLAASCDEQAMALVQAEFRSPHLRLYGSSDVAGVEIGGATKNVIAIAARVGGGLGR